MKLNTKQIHEFVQKYQKDLNALKGYFTKYQQNSLNSNKTIIEINQEIKKNLKSITGDKLTLKTIKQFAQNNDQRQSSQKHAEYIKFKISVWLTVCEGILVSIKEKIRLIDSKNQKKQLSDNELLEFKKFLTQAIITYEENKEAIVQHFSIRQINSNCILLQSLTNRMQRLGNT